MREVRKSFCKKTIPHHKALQSLVLRHLKMFTEIFIEELLNDLRIFFKVAERHGACPRNRYVFL